jgi:outer membrane protein OmpA-like peptidoglycan-associated protein
MKTINLLSLLTLLSLSVYAQPKKGELYDQSTVKMEILPVNTVQSDFGPAVIGDTLYFTSYRDELLDQTEKKLRRREFYDLYVAGLDSNGNVSTNRRVLEEFVTRYHDGPISWCEETGELFLTQSNYKKPGVWYNPFRENKINLRITITRKVDGVWQEPVDFTYNNPEYSVGHPAITQNGDTLVFSSNMPGGFGATDLYMSIRKDGVWGAPVNLGERINSPGKDEFPFFTAEGHLVFASDGRNGLGGMDMYYTKLSTSTGEVVHLDPPVNSNADDFSASFPAGVEYGYMSSNRPGIGNDDIYKLTFKRYMEYLLEISVMDAKSQRPINGAAVTFTDENEKITGPDGKVTRMVERDKEYNLTAKAFGYTDEAKRIKIGDYIPGTVVRDTVWMKMIVKKAIQMKNIYYAFDKWDILPESEAELDKLVVFMTENEDVTIELRSHTDSRGSNAYNLKLSQLRVQSAVDYIRSKGISPDRITAQGYGEEQLINKCANGVWCTPEEHRLNRRTEFIIPGIGESIPEEPSTIPEQPTIKKKETHTELPVKVYDKYYLVLGSFLDKANAEKFLKELTDQGLQAKIISDNPYKVGIGYPNLSLAKDDLIKLQGKYPKAWIF